MEKYGFVYITTNLKNNKKYIGKCIYKRKNNWKSYLGSGVLLKEDIEKYGKENFSRKILFEANDDEELNNMEEYYIGIYNAVEREDFYNIKTASIGGDCFTHNPRKEEIREMRKNQMSGKGNHQFGKKKTEKMINSVKEANSKAIEIDGVYYSSTAEASRILGLGNTTILYRINSKNFPNYKRL